MTDKVGYRYENIERIARGAYGEVHLAIDKQCGRQVAIKTVKIQSKREDALPKALFREIESLRLLSSSHVVNLIDVIPEGHSVRLVMEFLPSDLAEVLGQAQSYLPMGMIKTFAYKILHAIDYCHSRSIIHRDIKPSNILISASGDVKLCDFGLARIYDSSKPSILSHQVATRYYRAPELLYASKTYDFGVDIWAVGAIIAELMMLVPLFPGSNDIDQMFRVFQIMGTPDVEGWPEVADLPDYDKISFPEMKPIDLQILIPQVGRQDINFLYKFLQMNPKHRVSASQGLQDPYFQSSPLPYLQSELPCPERKVLRPEKTSLDEEALRNLVKNRYCSE